MVVCLSSRLVVFVLCVGVVVWLWWFVFVLFVCGGGVVVLFVV